MSSTKYLQNPAGACTGGVALEVALLTTGRSTAEYWKKGSRKICHMRDALSGRGKIICKIY